MNKPRPIPDRSAALQKMIAYLDNPGNFSVLVVGKAGSGKSHLINEAASQISKSNLFCRKIISKNACLFQETTEKWNEVLKTADKGVLVIDEIEKLSYYNQELLFEAISTTTGKFGFETKTIQCKLVFTSCFTIERLRDDRRYLQSKFFDRISQFIVKVPNFSQTAKHISTDFEATWIKMRFKARNEIPPMTGELKEWLTNFARQSHGNFRDLDKIIINWHNYRLMGHNDQEILGYIKDDFKDLLRYPEFHPDQGNVFVFQRGQKMKEILSNFRANLRKWAEDEYGNKYEAAKALDISVRSLERYI